MVLSALEPTLLELGQRRPLLGVCCDNPAGLSIIASSRVDQPVSNPPVDRLITDLQFTSEVRDIPLV